jgi:hypothetical protein
MTKIVGSDARFAQRRSLQSHTVIAAPLQHSVIPAQVDASEMFAYIAIQLGQR